MVSRNRIRVGRLVRYIPTAAEITAGGGGTSYPATISLVNRNGTVNLSVIEADGTLIAKTGVAQTSRAGGFVFEGVLPS